MENTTKSDMTRHQTSCMDDYDPASLDCDEARNQILKNVTPIAGQESISLRLALGRIISTDIQSSIDVPAHTNSAMDGYAIRGTDLPVDKLKPFKLMGTSFAGRPWTGQIHENECVRIMTGAVMPDGTDTVIMQEQVEVQDGLVRIGTEHKVGQNVRQAGEDLKKGQTVLNSGKRLTPADLGLIASLGIGEVRVRRKLRVAFFSTGDELRSIGEQLSAGEIYDSNRYTLYGMLTKLGAEIIDMGVIRDKPEDVQQAFSEASHCADVVITSGGVSVGEADYVTETLRQQGEVNFWKVAMKPGRPLTFGRLGEAVFFGLPGNPVSVMVTFYQFVQPALRHMMGESASNALILKARCLSSLRKKPGRTEFQRGVMETDDQGELIVHKTGEQGSGILRSMSEANCFIILAKETGRIEAGTVVDVQPFSDLV